MKVLVTMAGRGSRFREAGISKPKHEIKIRGKTMFDWAMHSLEAFFEHEFIFVTHRSHNASYFISDACNRLGIENYHEVQLSEYTDGQASSAYAANELISDSDSVGIYNIDTYIEEGELNPNILNGDGVIPIFKASGDRWSFVREDANGNVIEVSEKEKISNKATVGFYYFEEWGDFTDAYCTRSREIEDKYGETYIAPLYNYLIDHDRQVYSQEMDPEDVHVLGTPTDVRQFDHEIELD